MKPEDLREIGDLGAGNGGSVKKVTHLPTGTTMAKKVNFRTDETIAVGLINPLLRSFSSTPNHPFESKFYENYTFYMDVTIHISSPFMVHS
jgi:hypothetical protein